MSVNCKKSSYVRALAVAVVAMACASSAEAAIYTWDGGHATSGGWGQADNWSPNAVPTFDNTADIVVGAAGYARPISSIGGDRVIRSMTFNSNVTSATGVTFTNFATPARNLTMSAGGSINPSFTVESGATGNVTIGNPSGSGASGAQLGVMILTDDLVINQNSTTSSLTFNRALTGNGKSITKNGVGRWVLAAFSTNADIDSAGAVNLNGGTLEVFANFQNKTFASVGVNVTSDSNLDYNNNDLANNYNLTFSGAGAFALNADLTVRNISASPTNNNAINFSRNQNGSGDIVVSTGNNLASNAGNYSYQRLQLSGSNTGWSGDLVVARGSAQLSGNASQGTGAVVIGTTSDSFGAGLAFNQTSDVTFSRNITVRSGGFRGIKSNNLATGDITTTNFTGYNMTLSGDIVLEGTLSVDHSLTNSSTFSPSPVVTASHYVTLSGDISGSGGLNVTRVHVPAVNAPDSSRSRLVLSGVNTYTGLTSVSSAAALILDGSLTSDITVNGGRFGGDGASTGSLTMAAGSTFVFSPTATVDIDGVVTLDSSFGVASLVNVDGTALDWSLVSNGTYTLIGGLNTSTFNHIANFGLSNAAVVASGSKYAYFQNGSLQLVVTPVPEPTSLAMFVAIGSLVTLRRRRD